MTIVARQECECAMRPGTTRSAWSAAVYRRFSEKQQCEAKSSAQAPQSKRWREFFKRSGRWPTLRGKRTEVAKTVQKWCGNLETVRICPHLPASARICPHLPASARICPHLPASARICPLGPPLPAFFLGGRTRSTGVSGCRRIGGGDGKRHFRSKACKQGANGRALSAFVGVCRLKAPWLVIPTGYQKLQTPRTKLQRSSKSQAPEGAMRRLSPPFAAWRRLAPLGGGGQRVPGALNFYALNPMTPTVSVLEVAS